MALTWTDGETNQWVLRVLPLAVDQWSDADAADVVKCLLANPAVARDVVSALGPSCSPEWAVRAIAQSYDEEKVVSQELRARVDALAAERDGWQARWEELELSRATCCLKNEREVVRLTAENERLREALRQCVTALTCDDGDDSPDSHWCGRCDNFVDRGRTARDVAHRALEKKP